MRLVDYFSWANALSLSASGLHSSQYLQVWSGGHHHTLRCVLAFADTTGSVNVVTQAFSSECVDEESESLLNICVFLYAL